MNNVQFWLDDIQVSLGRNRIRRNNTTLNVAPKALLVLHFLATRPGQVVDVETILAEVWQGTVVSPNTLHRCISQLRKALEQLAPEKHYIQTHSRRGYSLDASIAWKEEVLKKPQPRSEKGNWLLLCTASVVVFFVYLFFAEQQPPLLEFKQSSVLTSTDMREAYGRYSPNGQFVAYQQQIDNCHSHIWLRDLGTGEDKRVTEKPGVFGGHHWSPDSNNLVLIQRNQCQADDKQEPFCWSLNRLDVANAISKPQTPEQLLDCGTNQIGLPRWIDDKFVAFLQIEQHKSPVLRKINLANGQVQDVYAPKTGRLNGLEIAQAQGLIVLSRYITDTGQSIDVLGLNGELRSSVPLPEAHKLATQYPLDYALHPHHPFMLVAAKSQLYQVSFDGSVQMLPLINQMGLSSPSFSADGNKAVFTQASADTDILLLDLTEQSMDSIEDLSQYRFARSNLSEHNPQMQPNGNAIAFTSNRSGRRQLWLWQGESSIQLSDTSSGLDNNYILWSPEGRQLATLVDGQLQLYSLNGAASTVASKHNLARLLQWLPDNQLLVLAEIDGKTGLFRWDQRDNWQLLTEDKVIWAQLTEDGNLVYLDNKQQLWRGTNSNFNIIEVLQGQSASHTLALEKGLLYGINSKKQLWRYQLSRAEFTVLLTLPDSARYVSDVTASSLLMTHMHRFDKELVELF